MLSVPFPEMLAYTETLHIPKCLDMYWTYYLGKTSPSSTEFQMGLWRWFSHILSVPFLGTIALNDATYIFSICHKWLILTIASAFVIGMEFWISFTWMWIVNSKYEVYSFGGKPTVMTISVQDCWFGTPPCAINFHNFYPNSLFLCFNIFQALVSFQE